MSSRTAPIMSAGLAIVLVVVGAIAFIAFFALSAYAPDLRDDTNGGANVLSKSAVGFAALDFLLDQAGIAASISRDEHVAPASATAAAPSPRFLILTPEEMTGAAKLEALARSGDCLIILPKWRVAGHIFHPGWVMKAGMADRDQLDAMLKTLAPHTKVIQSDRLRLVTLGARAPQYAGLWPKPVRIDSLQVISGADWDIEISDGSGHSVLARLRDTRIFVLADPDLLNTHGLHDRLVARSAVGLVNTLRAGAPVAFDVTLDGYGRAPSLLRAAFAPPFLGATLCAILAAALMGFHAMSRFGSPVRPQAVYAFGKATLLANSVGLIRLLNREAGMAPRYAAATRAVVAKLARGSREIAPEALQSLERRAGSASFAELAAEAGNVRGPAGAVKVARELYRWRMGITHEHS